ncbi:unnamed protein product [Cladocopium goreaui]|uniref:Peptidase S9 prolyl oligopeptidase catalytic domain-containing protein n=1 Tax=Cladocopium goreaui TaxID=2562237 RepID=A0A9P1G5P6_9DINO|nr:unnamed protein product [Cladocopium goreaui]
MGLSLAASFVFLPPELPDQQRAQASKNIVWDQRPAKLPGGGVARPFLWFSAPEGARSKRTVIFFHGNAEDLQLIEADIVQFTQAMKCNVLAVEYPGYGLCLKSKGCEEVSFGGVDDVAIHALLFCCQVKGIYPSQIVLHGRSLGSAPVLTLAKRAFDMFQWEIGGIILQCPFISVRQVAADYVGLAGSLLVPADCYNNMETMRRLCQSPGRSPVPILILHGQLDKVIKPYHGRTLLKQAQDLGHPCIEGHFPANATHNHWSLREDLVKPMDLFLQKYMEGWNEQAGWLGDGPSLRCF